MPLDRSYTRVWTKKHGTGGLTVVNQMHDHELFGINHTPSIANRQLLYPTADAAMSAAEVRFAAIDHPCRLLGCGEWVPRNADVC